MRKLLLVTLFLLTTLSAKVLYLSYEKVPTGVIKGEVFTLTLKTISTVKEFEDIEYKFKNYWGVKLLNRVPYREADGQTYRESFQFLVTKNAVKLPDITATLIASQKFSSSTIKGKKLTSIALNPKSDFSNIVANSLEVIEYKTTSYDIQHNIIILTAIADNANLKAMKFQNVFKQGIESVSKTYVDPRITYFIIIDKKIEDFSFTYFDLISNRFEKITIPIVVDDDSVTTQTDLKPKDQSKEKIKINIAGSIAIVILLFALWRRRYVYLVLVIFPGVYIAYISTPTKIVCIKQGTNIHLLPVKNGTIFETTSSEYNLQKEGSVTNFIKVKLENEKIGWVKNEDICSP
ncbi:hypothetical protein JHD48_07480 [Sulfurimonas sp. SAG-AH-194-I05]|nr:hypothetical protein [Sulfurimonas sp. SAG-AH-194-I05]MDF1875572.1 hypothetical protein [Sulfurimonas sp. SAG-AH-194-I05]